MDSSTAEPTHGEAAASAVSATATDARSASAPATDAGEETATGDDVEADTEMPSDDGDSPSDSSDESEAPASDDVSDSSASDEESSSSSDGASDTSESDANTDDSDAEADTDSAADADEDETTTDEAAMEAADVTATTETATVSTTAAASTEDRTEWTVTVTTVADGDSLLVEFPDGHLEKVDLVGVDAPDGDYSEDDFLGMATEDGGEAWLNDWGGKATGFLSDEIGGQDVTIHVDSEADRRDDSGTLQVYVDDGDTATLNEDLVERGYAEVADYSFSKQEAFEQREEDAYQGHDGLWNFYEPDPLADLPGESDETETETATEEPTEWTVTVTMVADGDSLLVEFPDGHLEKVDLVGVDAPDGDYSEDDFLGMATEDGGEAWLNDWGGKATDFVSSEVEGREVTIYVDSVADRRDDSGTLQVYVDDGDSATLNADLIERGYAEVADYSFAKQAAFEQEEENAYQGYNGLWRFYEPDPLAGLPGESDETETETVTATPVETTETAEATTDSETETATETAVPTESDSERDSDAPTTASA